MIARGSALSEGEFMRALGKRLRLLRLVREFNQDEVAEAAGISRSFVSLLEHGAHGVDVLRLRRVAEALGVSLVELLDVGSPLTGLPAGSFVPDRVEGLPS